MKLEAHKNGWFHQTVHIWFYTSDGKVLLQQRGENKNIYPLYWDVSVAGHIAAGENIETAVFREIEEEIGIVVPILDLQKIGVFKSVQEHQNGLMDREFHHTFLTELKVPLERLRPQESEVACLALILMDAFYTDVLEGRNIEKYVPHSLAYYRTVFGKLHKCMN